ncbi:hypothetical protein GQR58_003676 [Nymphon striatum]|nr:hypothetical protein GQR58_003676 [Nymphon striatum]
MSILKRRQIENVYNGLAAGLFDKTLQFSSYIFMALDLTTRCPRATCQIRQMSKGPTPYQVVMGFLGRISEVVCHCLLPSHSLVSQSLQGGCFQGAPRGGEVDLDGTRVISRFLTSLFALQLADPDCTGTFHPLHTLLPIHWRLVELQRTLD